MKQAVNMTSYGVILLAAGSSNRLGRPKQLLPYQGKSLLKHALEQVDALEWGVKVLVLGAQVPLLEAEAGNWEGTILVNEQFEEGIASSIRCAVAFVKEQHPQIETLMISLCDQVYVHSEHLIHLIETHRQTVAKIVASYYSERKGVPALFDRSLFTELLNLKGDVGAKYLIEKQGDQVALVPFPLGALDVDTEEAYKQWLASEIVWEKKHHVER